jgi:hypothetical protein
MAVPILYFLHDFLSLDNANPTMHLEHVLLVPTTRYFLHFAVNLTGILLQHPFHLQPLSVHFGQKQIFSVSHALTPTTMDPAGHVAGAITEQPSSKSHDFICGVPEGMRQCAGAGSEMVHEPPSAAIAADPSFVSFRCAYAVHVTKSSLTQPADAVRSGGHCRATVSYAPSDDGKPTQMCVLTAAAVKTSAPSDESVNTQ